MDETARLRAADRQFVWHPFTQMQQWQEDLEGPLILSEGEGCWLRDSTGRPFLDANSSIWTNVHGHRHPRITNAIVEQLQRVAHTSFLGTSNPPAIRLAQRLIELVDGSHLRKVFFSDNGSTGIEVAIKMAVQFFQQNGRAEKAGFVAFENAYHGDTLGAASVGGITLFHDRFRHHHFPVIRIRDPGQLEALDPAGIAAVVIEPLIQGAAGMQLWPEGMLQALRDWCDRSDVLLIFDEVMTGFGRTETMFACQRERVWPDFLVLTKGLTGGYLPLAATLTTERVFAGFLGSYREQRTFYYGHSYAGNALGCAAALANLESFEQEKTLEKLPEKVARQRARLGRLRTSPFVKEIRECGFIAGIEVQAPVAIEQLGARVCAVMRRHQVLTRPIRDVIVLMLPLVAQQAEIEFAVEALEKAILAICEQSPARS